LERQLNHLRDHFIICGYGRIGTQIAIEFDDHKVPYAVIEQNPEALERLHNENRLHIEGDAASEDILQQAGIERARGLISAVDSDERSVYITLSARALNPGLFIISRGGRPDSTRRLELAGANRVISPYRMAGHRMAELAVHPALVDVLDTLHHGGSEMESRRSWSAQTPQASGGRSRRQACSTRQERRCWRCVAATARCTRTQRVIFAWKKAI
jgi:Kef-type K+ transport systems, predicted NAD-binding component